MKSKILSPLTLLLSLSVLTFGATFSRTLALFFSFDAGIGYFAKGAPIVILSHLFLALCALCAVAIPFLINKEHLTKENPPLSAAGFLGAGACALSFCATALFLIWTREDLTIPTLVPILTALFLLPGALYFACSMLNDRPACLPFLGYAAILAAVFCIGCTYFDAFTQMNAPHKLSVQLSMLCVMFALLFEQRATLDRAMPRAALTSTALAASLCTAFALPNVIAFIGGVYDSLLYFFFDLTVLMLGVYFAAKVFALLSHPNSDTNEKEIAQ